MNVPCLLDSDSETEVPSLGNVRGRRDLQMIHALGPPFACRDLWKE